jgi:hypothetical protein
MFSWLTAIAWPKLAGVLWHGFKRFSSVILVGLLIVLPFIALHQYGDRHYNTGYKAGYACAIKDNPTQTYASVGTVVNQKCKKIKSLSLNILGLHLGAWVESN